MGQQTATTQIPNNHIHNENALIYLLFLSVNYANN